MSRQMDALVGDNLPLVQAVACRSFPDRKEDQDLLQSGRIALWQAAVRWDGQRPFRPYACACIHNAMAQWCKAQSRWQSPPAASGLPNDESSQDWQEEVLADLALAQRITSAWPPGSDEYYVLTALAAGVPKDRLAARLGCETWALTRLARRAWSRVPL